MSMLILEDGGRESAATDEAVLASSVDNPAVFAVLVDRYGNALQRKARSILGSREDAEDAVQETFTKIYLNAKKFRPVRGATFKSWMYKILVNTCFSHYKKTKRRREVTFTMPQELLELVPADDGLTEKAELADYVASLLTLVPKKTASLLRMRYLAGKSHKEIAEEKGISVGAVKTRIYRAKKELRRVSADVI